jgi:hypothetical protein
MAAYIVDGEYLITHTGYADGFAILFNANGLSCLK